LLFRPVDCEVAVAFGSTTPFDSPGTTCASVDGSSIASTPPGEDDPANSVLLPSYDGGRRYVLGPADLNGSVVRSTSIGASPVGDGYQVYVDFTALGTKEFDTIAAARYSMYQLDETRPGYGALEAMDVAGVVEAAPAIQAPVFNGVAVISGSPAAPFTKAQAEALAAEIWTP
jgi:hypothetical protein